MQNSTPSTPSTPPEKPDMQPSLLVRLRAWLASGSGLSRTYSPPFAPHSINDALDVTQQDWRRRQLEARADYIRTELAEKLYGAEQRIAGLEKEKAVLADIIAQRDAALDLANMRAEEAEKVAAVSMDERAALRNARLSNAELNFAIQYAIYSDNTAWLEAWSEGDLEADEDEDFQRWKRECGNDGGRTPGAESELPSAADVGPDEMRIMQDCMGHERSEPAPVQSDHFKPGDSIPYNESEGFHPVSLQPPSLLKEAATAPIPDKPVDVRGWKPRGFA